MNFRKPYVKKCLYCGKNLKRFSHSKHHEKEPYKGNLICYRKKTSIYPWKEKEEDKKCYSYILWDGESYHSEGGFFHGKQCAARYAVALVKKRRGIK